MLSRFGGGASGAQSTGDGKTAPLWVTISQDYDRLQDYKVQFDKKCSHAAQRSRDWAAEINRIVSPNGPGVGVSTTASTSSTTASSGGRARGLFKWGATQQPTQPTPQPSTSPSYDISIDTQQFTDTNASLRAELFTKRLAQLNDSEEQLHEAESKGQSLLKELQGNISSLILFELADHDIRRLFGERPPLLHMYQRQLRLERGGQPSRRPYYLYEDWIAEIRSAYPFIHLLRFLYSFQTGCWGEGVVPPPALTDPPTFPNMQRLALIIFEHTKGVLVKDLSQSPLPNWPALRNCFSALNNMRSSLRKEKTAGKTSTNGSASNSSTSTTPTSVSRYSPEEMDFVVSRLNAIQAFLFNSHSSPLLKFPQDTVDMFNYVLDATASAKKGAKQEKKKPTKDKKGDEPEKGESVDEEIPRPERSVQKMLATFVTDDPDKELMAEFISVAEYSMGAFREVVERNSCHDILKVEGDGNCFFRAVIKYHFPEVPRDWEDQMSLKLRQSLNNDAKPVEQDNNSDSTAAPTPDESAKKDDKKKRKEEKKRKKELKRNYRKGKAPAAVEDDKEASMRASEDFNGFVIENLNDAGTMAEAGVWADHVQVEKLARRLRRPINLLTFDDIGLHTDNNLAIYPGVEYCVGAKYAQSPSINLYFTPTPGHYEALKDGPTGRTPPESSESLWKRFVKETSSMKDFTKLSPLLVCNCFFMLAKEGELIQKLFENFSAVGDTDLIKVLYNDMSERAKLLNSRLRTLNQVLQKLDENYVNTVKTDRSYPIYDEIISTLIGASKAQTEGEESIGGPLTHIRDMVNHIVAMAQEKASAVTAYHQAEQRERQQQQQWAHEEYYARKQQQQYYYQQHPGEGPSNSGTSIAAALLGGLKSVTSKPTNNSGGTAGGSADKPPSSSSSSSQNHRHHAKEDGAPPAKKSRRPAKLMSDPETSANDWRAHLLSASSNTLTIDDVHVAPPSLTTLFACLAEGRIKSNSAEAYGGKTYLFAVQYIVFNKCHFSENACNVLTRVKHLPSAIKVVQLNSCRLDLKEVHLRPYLLQDNPRLRVA
eukprot:TRINITY_DN4594_c0_g1_i2.p1 TRINITY_DN4594_c0_g1~~TRINITY_DN4594_c0_g1_i2.p1  ORF type:complete len:1051 (+),score=220.86 TRINITY_DN4594_c0_g1_i2:132-3284(+)